ncbi:MAG: MBL fold metallo-hydrolase [Actinomycetota bacterium]|nr:MBL fold metallo-hydrolase [Actinomycetota bacterium]
MNVTIIPTPGLGDSTYVFEHDGVGLIVDPQRDIDRFVQAAAHLDTRFVLETHLHNDYVSGGRAIAATTGAELVIPASAGVAFRHRPAFHHEELDGGAFTVRPIHTPGHTPEHVSYLVLVDDEAVALFSGGSLLVGSAGRTDLLGVDRADQFARLQYGSVTRLAALPERVPLYPTHGAGSFCTASIAETTTSSIGTERRSNPVLGHSSEDSFVVAALADLQPYPDYYASMGPINLAGPEPIPRVQIQSLSVDEIPDGAFVVDIRPHAEYAAGHLPGSYGLELEDQMGVWTGWLVPFNESIVLVAGADPDVESAVTQLARIGYDNVVGVVDDLGSHADLRTYNLAPIADFLLELQIGSPQILDVRAPGEWAAGSIPGSIHRYVPDLRDGLPDDLDVEQPVWIICGGGYRSEMAVHYLEAGGFRPTVVVGGGVADVLASLSV